jgi:hypothetical protein
VLRNAALAVGFVIVMFVAFQLIHTSDLEHVEAEMEHLFEVAQEGGERAVEEILAAFADDYRGTGPFRMASIRRNLRYALVPAGTASNLKHGDFSPVAKGEEILVPIVSVGGEVKGNPVRLVVSVMWAPRDGKWKIVDITRWRMGE